jgi:hypothetical protein
MSYQSISPGPRLCLWIFRNKIRFNRKELLAPHPNPKLEDHPLSAVRDSLFNIFAATLHIRGRSSIHNLRTFQTVVTGTHLSHGLFSYIDYISSNVRYTRTYKRHIRKYVSVVTFMLLLFDSQEKNMMILLVLTGQEAGGSGCNGGQEKDLCPC